MNAEIKNLEHESQKPKPEIRLTGDERLLKLLLASPEQKAAIDRILEGKAEPGKESAPTVSPLVPPPLAPAEPYITKAEIAQRLKKDLRTMTIWMRKGLLPYYKIGKSVLFKWSEVEKQLTLTSRTYRGRVL